MLVPPHQACRESMLPQPQGSFDDMLESNEAIQPPGATISGLIRPSAVGPRLLKPMDALKSSAGNVPGGGTVGRKFSEAPVVITFFALPGLPSRQKRDRFPRRP